MSMRTVGTAVLVAVFACAGTRVASAQTPPPTASVAPAPAAAAPAPATAPATAEPGAAPAATPSGPAQPAAPPGYMLVPMPPGSEQTRYDVQYPQTRGALELPYEDGEPIPPGYRLVKRKRKGLIIAGAIVTGVPWALGVMGAVTDDFEDNTGLLVLPVIGPWAMLASKSARDRSCSVGGDVACTAGKAVLRGALVFDGLVQAAGGAMFLAGMLAPRVRLVRNDVVVSVVPTTLGHGGYGLGAIGSF